MEEAQRQLEHTDFVPAGQRYPLILLASGFKTPGNVGSLFRIADALGLEQLLLAGDTPRPPNSKLRKLSRSSEKYVPHQHEADVVAAVSRLKRAGYRIVCLEITDASIPLHQLRLQPEERVCLIPGSESEGVSANLLALADTVTHIPMQGFNSSMNVANACAIACYEITRQLRPCLPV